MGLLLHYVANKNYRCNSNNIQYCIFKILGTEFIETEFTGNELTKSFHNLILYEHLRIITNNNLIQ